MVYVFKKLKLFHKNKLSNLTFMLSYIKKQQIIYRTINQVLKLVYLNKLK
jgi:hypothetical protein